MGKAAQPITKQEDVEKLLTAVMDPRDRLLINISIRTAFRYNEIANLQWKHLVINGLPIMHLTRTIANKGGNRKKGTKPTPKKRTVKLTKEMRNEIAQAYIKLHPFSMDTFVFTPKRGNVGYSFISNTGVNIILKKYAAQLNIAMDEEISHNTLRKTGCYWFYKKALRENPDTALKDTSLWMKHSSPTVTMFYLGLDREKIERITDAMNLSNACTPLEKIQAGNFEWKDYWSFVQNYSDSPENSMYEYIDFHTENTGTDIEIRAALDYVKAVGIL